MSTRVTEGQKQWDAFLERWPVSRLRDLTLEEYYGPQGSDTLFGWLRDRTGLLGDFQEGPASAGVRPRGRGSRGEPASGLKADDRYIWYSILGNSAEQAFANLKQEMLIAVEAVQRGDLDGLKQLSNAPGALVWKVAFLYQDRSRPLLLPFNTLVQLKRVATGAASNDKIDLQRQLMAQRGDKALLAYAEELERQVVDHQGLVADRAGRQIALNQILFGPPGTGKTFATIDAALEILAPEFIAANRENRAALKTRFDELVAEGQVRFVTFHQSFSYEDFVEGLRAVTDEESGQIRYEVMDGVFKSLCETAAAKVTIRTRETLDLAGRKIWKMSLGNTLGYDAFIYDECIENGYALLGYGDQIDFSGCRNVQEIHQRFVAAGQNLASDAYAVRAVATFLLKVRPGDLVVVTDGNYRFRAIGEVAGEYEVLKREDPEEGYGQCRRVKWLRVYSPSLPYEHLMKKIFSQATIYRLHDGSIDQQKLAQLLEVSASEAGTVESFAQSARVLIIDEINRGNVSRIFGELITLIEESKRAGADEALSVVLPYSKERFSVPDNVYLIGTMNTADRSLAGLDIALRRRFTFCEMPPRPELLDEVVLEGINIGQLLRTMNERIEVLLDRDHCLGHAYFMPLMQDNSLERLEAIFRNQVLPLLQEYFFEDWQRIQWVLNDHRKAALDRFVYQSERDLRALFGAEAEVSAHNLPWRINEAAFGRAAAYAGIIAVQAKVAAPLGVPEAAEA